MGVGGGVCVCVCVEDLVELCNILMIFSLTGK